jgi:hypothetical protein
MTEAFSLEEELARIFRKNGWQWHLKGDKWIIPDEEDILDALDEAARVLYDKNVGDRLEVGRLIIEKRPLGHDVYVFAGTFE